jgi:hypothetical protein
MEDSLCTMMIGMIDTPRKIVVVGGTFNLHSGRGL